METNLTKASFSGILSDPAPLDAATLIPNARQLDDNFVSFIANKLPQPIPGENGKKFNLVDNTDDPFLNGEPPKIDFPKQDVIVTRGATIDKVTASGNCYYVTYGEKGCEYMYYAYIIQAPTGGKPKSIEYKNEKPKIKASVRVFIP